MKIKFTYIALLVIAMTAGAVILDILFLRQLLAFIFLTIIPGSLILRILKIHPASKAATLCYTVGLSLAFVMCVGVVANFLLPLIGIAKPISLSPLLIIFAGCLLVLTLIAYKRDKGVIALKWANPLSLPFVIILSLPLLAIVGARVMHHYTINIVLFVFLLEVVVVVALVALGKVIPARAYPALIISMAIALLYHTTLSSNALYVGSDIVAEYGYTMPVIEDSYWSFWTQIGVSTALSLVMLCPVYSIMLDMHIMWVFKIIYPLFFCLVSLILFLIYRKQFSGKVAFLSAFFFISVLFFTAMLGAGRQLIAELFFALVILLLVERELPMPQKAILAGIFVVAITVSHYAMGYICFTLLLLGWFVTFLARSKLGQRMWKGIGRDRAFSLKSMAIILSIFLVSAVCWYNLIGTGINRMALFNIAETSTSVFWGAFFDLSAREPLVQTALGLDFLKVSATGKSFRIFQYLIELFLIVGCIELVFGLAKKKLKIEFVALCIAAGFTILLCIVHPTFSGNLESERFFQTCLMLLAPMGIMGGLTVTRGCAKLLRLPQGRNYLPVVALVAFIPYFIFTSGVVYELTKSISYGQVDTPSSQALSGYRLGLISFIEEGE